MGGGFRPAPAACAPEVTSGKATVRADATIPGRPLPRMLRAMPSKITPKPFTTHPRARCAFFNSGVLCDRQGILPRGDLVLFASVDQYFVCPADSDQPRRSPSARVQCQDLFENGQALGHRGRQVAALEEPPRVSCLHHAQCRSGHLEGTGDSLGDSSRAAKNSAITG